MSFVPFMRFLFRLLESRSTIGVRNCQDHVIAYTTMFTANRVLSRDLNRLFRQS